MDKEVESRIQSVMSSVFGVPADEIDDDASPDNIESWDSLKHMNLMLLTRKQKNQLLHVI